VRHGQPREQRLVGRDVHQHAAVGTPVAPAVRHVGIGDQRDVARRPILERKPIEVAAVLRRQPAEERRPPQRPEARAVAYRRDAGEQRVDEDRPAVSRKGDVMGIDIAGDPGGVRREHRVVLPVRAAARHHVVEAEQLIVRGENKRAHII
jgi:hypothetical protein